VSRRTLADPPFWTLIEARRHTSGRAQIGVIGGQ
jgi:hypothetical protein